MSFDKVSQEYLVSVDTRYAISRVLYQPAGGEEYESCPILFTHISQTEKHDLVLYDNLLI